ncbi:hypothetical protein LIER_32688 [Lithospermum erythrorhizon]|uniref:Uncharacterized protein n=1 Tax=Lithospermum erythrorhizon TaxID=34254 RepID=A0AAV3RXN6_LITER
MKEGNHIAPSLNPRTQTRNNVSKAPTTMAGPSPAKVPLKVRNQSKLSSGSSKGSKWTTCHIHPKDNAKKKLNPPNVVSNYKLKTCNHLDVRPGFKVSGSSAADLLDHFEDSYHFDNFEEDQENDV